MTKKYILTAKQNFASIILTGRGGNRVRFDFTRGSVMQNQPASFITSNEYYQKLLEESEYVKKGVIRLSQTINTPRKAVKAEAETVTGIKDARSAIEWVANTFGVKVTSGRAATEYARKQGYILTE